ncbi:MAG: hypothetical protein IPK64_18700 [bacterium]|nr:hypothetical protein [bacterium]
MKEDQNREITGIFRTEAWERLSAPRTRNVNTLQRAPGWIGIVFVVVCLCFIIAMVALSLVTTDIRVSGNGFLAGEDTSSTPRNGSGEAVAALLPGYLESTLKVGQKAIVLPYIDPTRQLAATLTAVSVRPSDDPEVQRIRRNLSPTSTESTGAVVLVHAVLDDRVKTASIGSSPCSLIVSVGSPPLILTLIPGLRQVLQ